MINYPHTFDDFKVTLGYARQAIEETLFSPDLKDGAINRFSRTLSALPKRFGRTAVLLCPLTGMERAYHFLRGFYEIVEPDITVMTLVTPLSDDHGGTLRKPMLEETCREALREVVKDRTVILLDDIPFPRKATVAWTWKQLGNAPRKKVELPTHNKQLLGLGRDSCITAIKDRYGRSILSLSEVVQRLRRDANVNLSMRCHLNGGLVSALGRSVEGDHLFVPPDELRSVSHYFFTTKSRAYSYYRVLDINSLRKRIREASERDYLSLVEIIEAYEMRWKTNFQAYGTALAREYLNGI